MNKRIAAFVTAALITVGGFAAVAVNATSAEAKSNSLSNSLK